MILIPKSDVIVTVAVSTDDMPQQPTQIVLKNLQTKKTQNYSVTDVRTTERTAIYKFYNIRTTSPVEQPNITYTKLEDGTYTYKLGNEIGLFQVGIPKLDKKAYADNPTNKVYYNG